MELFPNAALIRETQKDLDDLIQQGVFQITRLLKNTEKAASNTQDVDPYTISQRSSSYSKGLINDFLNEKRNLLTICMRLEPRISGSGGGRLTERLLAQGLLTPAMLDELRNEWDRKSDPSSDDEQKFHKKGPRRKTKRKT